MNQPRALKRFKQLAETILDQGNPAYTLRPEILEMANLLEGLGTFKTSPHDDISKGETRTKHGLAVSPKMAAMCAEDYMRTIRFIRGTHDAILSIRKESPERPVRILYAGCGPHATLCIPLMVLLILFIYSLM